MPKVAERIARPEKRLYSIKEAAAYLGRSPWSVAEMIRTGQIAYVQNKSRRKFLDICDLDLWIEANKKRDDY